MKPLRIPTRLHLKAFSIALSMIAVLGAVALILALRASSAVIVALAIFVAGSALGLWFPATALKAYELWERQARRARKAARLWLLGVAFLILWLVGLPGARLPMNRRGRKESGWIDRTQLSPDEEAPPYLIRSDERATSWVGRFSAWTWRSGNVWALSLIPILWLLKAVEGESRGSLGGNVYTLY